jgi:hypothetical protein
VDLAILSLSENSDLQRITDKWLTSGSSADDLDADRLHVHRFAALFLICGVTCLLAFAIHTAVLYRQYARHVSRSRRTRPRSPLGRAPTAAASGPSPTTPGGGVPEELQKHLTAAMMAAGGFGPTVSNSRVSFTPSNSTSTSMSR